MCESYKDESREIFETMFGADYVLLPVFTNLKLVEIAPTSDALKVALRNSVQCTEVEESKYEDIERAVVITENLICMGIENLFAILGSENHGRARIQVTKRLWNIFYGDGRPNDISGKSDGCSVKLSRWRTVAITNNLASVYSRSSFTSMNLLGLHSSIMTCTSYYAYLKWKN